MLIDLHTHTRRFSWDSDLTPDELVDLSKRAGLDGICLTEHDFFWDEDDVRSMRKKHDFLVISGVEINTDDGHMLCFGLRSYVYGMHRAPQLAAWLDTAGGVMVAAHPYRRQLQPGNRDGAFSPSEVARAATNPAYAGCAAMERINGRGGGRENAFAAACCDLLGLAGTAGSDAHTTSDVGTCATEFPGRITGLEDLIAALKSGNYRAVMLSMDSSRA
jgi:predicted metal-dependent phosphoesterase TrpH